MARAHGNHALAARAALWLVRRRFTSGTEAIGRWIDVSPLESVLADRDLPVGIQAQVHGLLAEIAFQANDLARARDQVAIAKSLAATVSDDFVRFWVAFSDGLAHLGVLELDSASRAFGEADRRVRRSGPHFLRSLGTSRSAMAEILSGNLEAADRLAGVATSNAQDAANWAEHALAETSLAIVAALRGRFGDQEDHGELALISCGRSSNTYTPLVLHPVVAWCRAARGDREGMNAALDDLDAAGGRSGRYRLALELMTDDPEQIRKELTTGYDWRPHPPALTAYDAGAHAAELELAIHARNRTEVRGQNALSSSTSTARVAAWSSSGPP